MVSALALVVGLMMVLAAIARRVMGGRALTLSEAPLVQVLGTGYLGPRKTIALVAVAGDLLIVGTTATDLVSLGRVSDPEEVRRLLSRSKPGDEMKVQVEAEGSERLGRKNAQWHVAP
jgi:flagellar protein FliO/FliZ